jgi:hypothetical protein
MTALEYRDYQLICDGKECNERFYDGHETPRARLRLEARKAGWTHTRSCFGRKYDDDFCPKHKPEETAENVAAS